MAITASGRWWYEGESGYSLYWDDDCNGEGKADRWIFDTSEPSTTTAFDLDGDGGCSYMGRIFSTASFPTSGTWRMFCDGAWIDNDVVIMATSVCETGEGANDDNTGCETCQAGSSSTGSTRCTPCDAGEYAPSAGSSACLPCGEVLSSFPGATSCVSTTCYTAVLIDDDASGTGSWASNKLTITTTETNAVLSELTQTNPIYTSGGECVSVYGWYDDYGDSCQGYADYNWCGNYGYLSGTGGYTAYEACCACGGGLAGVVSVSEEELCLPASCAVEYLGIVWGGSYLYNTAWRLETAAGGVIAEAEGGDGTKFTLACATVCEAGENVNEADNGCEPCAAGSSGTGGNDQDCSPCSEGKFSEPGAALCTNCAAGTYSSAGAPVCSDCTAGSYSWSGSGSCFWCSEGKYSEPGAGLCTDCAAGTYSPSTSAASCTTCASGKYSTVDSASCTACPSGKFNPSTGQAECQLCVNGFESISGSPSCSLRKCYTVNLMDSAGNGWLSSTKLKIRNSNGAVATMLTLDLSSGGSKESVEVCLLDGCFEGVVTGYLNSQESWNIQDEDGDTLAAASGPDLSCSSSCQACNTGSGGSGCWGAVHPNPCCSIHNWCEDCDEGWGLADGGDDCTGCTGTNWESDTRSFCISPSSTVCEIGKEANFEDDGCVPCAAGKFSTSTNSIPCHPCAVGSYSSGGDLNAEGECLQCPPGKANAEVEGRSSAFCLDCAAGESTGGQEGQAECVDCSAGKYAGLASPDCVLCASGTMSAVGKSEACTDCPAGEYSGGGSSACR